MSRPRKVLPPGVTELKSVVFLNNIIISQNQVKAINLDSFQDIELHSNYVSFTDGQDIFCVPLANIVIMVKL